MIRMTLSPIATLVAGVHAAARHAVADTLSRIPAHLLELAAAAGTKIVVLRERQRYATVSPALRRLGAGVDAWPSPPAGLFVVEERTLYLRSTSPMTIAHEFFHAVDAALGGGLYLSTIDAEIQAAFAAATRFVTPYAASAVDEYFAESARAMTDTNDGNSLWPKATPERLRTCDPTMFDIITRIFTSPNAHP